jgi:hypothetical protein
MIVPWCGIVAHFHDILSNFENFLSHIFRKSVGQTDEKAPEVTDIPKSPLNKLQNGKREKTSILVPSENNRKALYSHYDIHSRRHESKEFVYRQFLIDFNNYRVVIRTCFLLPLPLSLAFTYTE